MHNHDNHPSSSLGGTHPDKKVGALLGVHIQHVGDQIIGIVNVLATWKNKTNTHAIQAPKMETSNKKILSAKE